MNRQRAGATDEPFARAANNIMPAAAPDVMDALTGSLNNLALAATNGKTALQQLTAANLALRAFLIKRAANVCRVPPAANALAAHGTRHT